MGPLEGVKVIEMAGIGPGPFCAMMLSDMGAEVLRVDRTEDSGLGVARDPRFDLMNRGRRSVAVDLKQRDGVELVLNLVEQADAFIDVFRPGVTERLGVGPKPCLERNPRLIYGRMTGFGQEGPLAHAAGHDINYIALAGALNAIGPKGQKPLPPLNLVGDFGGGGMYLAFGIACALLERERSGQGQVVDAAMVDGAASLMTIFFGMRAEGLWRDERGVNVIDSGAHFYDTYETADGKYVSVGSIEPKFYAELLRLGGLEGENLPPQFDQDHWPETSARLARLFKSKSRDEWCEIMEGSDVCFAPVLSFDEVAGHPHNRARETFVEVDRVLQPAPAPRFSRSEAAIQGPPARRGQHTRPALADWGVGGDRIEALMSAGVIAE